MEKYNYSGWLESSAVFERKNRPKLILLIVVGLVYSFALAWFFQGLPNAKLTSDFFPRWYASRMMITTGRSVYDWANAAEISAVTGWPKLHQLGYYYPAYLLIFTAPLSMLPYGVAHVIWVMLGIWFLWLGMAVFARLTAPQMSLNRFTILLVLMTTAVPMFQHTLYAQFNSIGVLALALSYRALYRTRYFAAGLWAGGLLFKPQATMIPLIFFLLWTALRRERWGFWMGLGVISIALWAVAELLEPYWVFSFLGTLGRYEPVQSVVDILLGNPYQIISLILLGLTLWLIYRIQKVAAGNTLFIALLAWTICLNALIVPMFGMLHIVLAGPALVMLMGIAEQQFPDAARWIWRGIVALFVMGLLAFILPLLLTASTGLQINSAEAVYRFTLPGLGAAVALWLIFRQNKRVSV